MKDERAIGVGSADSNSSFVLQFSIFEDKFQTVEPFGAFIGVELRHQQAHGTAVVGLQVLTIVLENDQGIIVIQRGKGQVGRVAGPGMGRDILRARQGFGTCEDLANMHAFPGIIVAAPGGHAMKIAGQRGAWQSQKLFPAQAKGILNLPSNIQLPVRRKFGRALIAEHRPFLRQVLSRRKTIQAIWPLFNRLISCFLAKKGHK